MWRGIYLTLLPGLEKKIRVLFDWLIDLFFPRDVVLTADAETPTLPEMIQTGRQPVSAAPQPRSKAEEERRE